SRRRHTRFSRDWSSDVCSSDLLHGDHDVAVVEIDPRIVGEKLGRGEVLERLVGRGGRVGLARTKLDVTDDRRWLEPLGPGDRDQIGRASCRGSVESSVEAGAAK